MSKQKTLAQFKQGDTVFVQEPVNGDWIGVEIASAPNAGMAVALKVTFTADVPDYMVGSTLSLSAFTHATRRLDVAQATHVRKRIAQGYRPVPKPAPEPAAATTAPATPSVVVVRDLLDRVGGTWEDALDLPAVARTEDGTFHTIRELTRSLYNDETALIVQLADAG